MKIIFLDIDGVLNVGGTRIDSYGQSFQPEFVANLAKIIKETEAEIVISSTWRMSGLDVMRNMWRDRNLPGNVKGITPRLESRIRGEEIKEWIKLTKDKVNIEKYVIFDDDDDMLVSQFPYFIQCSNLKDEDAIHGYGLTKRLAEKAIEILNSNTDV